MPDPIVEITNQVAVVNVETDPDVVVNVTLEPAPEVVDIGVIGPQGPIGITGATGPIGPTGATGPQGIQGLPGDGVEGNNDVGVFYLKNNTIPTVIGSINARAVVAGNIQTGRLLNFVKDPSANALKYIGPGGIFHIIATFNFFEGSQKTCGFYVGRNTDETSALDPNADRISESEIYINSGTSSNQPVGGSIQSVLELNTNDRIFFIVQNKDAATAITVEFLKFVATPLTAEKGDIGASGATGATGPAGATTLSNLTDVDAASKVDKSVLVWNESTGKFTASDQNTIITITDGGNF